MTRRVRTWQKRIFHKNPFRNTFQITGTMAILRGEGNKTCWRYLIKPRSSFFRRSGFRLNAQIWFQNLFVICSHPTLFYIFIILVLIWNKLLMIRKYIYVLNLIHLFKFENENVILKSRLNYEIILAISLFLLWWWVTGSLAK